MIDRHVVGGKTSRNKLDGQLFQDTFAGLHNAEVALTVGTAWAGLETTHEPTRVTDWIMFEIMVRELSCSMRF